MSQNSDGNPPLTLNVNLAINIPRDAFKQGDTMQSPNGSASAATASTGGGKKAGDFEHRVKDAFDIAKGDNPSNARGLLVRQFRKVKGEAPQAKTQPNAPDNSSERSR